MTKTKKKRILWGVLIGLGAILLLVLGYLLYVVCSYYRVEDNLTLKVEGNATAVAPVGEELTLVTYNIGFGAYSPEYSFFMDGGEYSRGLSEEAVKANTEGALKTIQAQNADFVLAQEVDVEGTRSYDVNQTAILAEGLTGYDRVFGQNYDSPYFLYPFTSPIGANRSGIMTFSKYNMTSSLRRSLPIEESLYKFLDLDRAYTRSVIPTENGRELVLYNVHLSAYTSDGTIADDQLDMLIADMQGEYQKGNYVIAAGDFNKDMLLDSSKYFDGPDLQYNWAKGFNTAVLPEEFSIHTGKNVPSCRNTDAPYKPGETFVVTLDGALVSDNVEVLTTTTIDNGFAYSDHQPVKVTFKLK